LLKLIESSKAKGQELRGNHNEENLRRDDNVVDPQEASCPVTGKRMKNILIAEDNAVNRELLRELLEMRGYSVVEACNGEEALRVLAESRPEALLLDLGMPVLDGYRTVQKIRENPRWTTLPVLAVTAYAMQGDKERILSCGFDGYLSKPINPTLLFQEIERVLSTGGEVASEDRAGAEG
jgi:two-component system sensor histidine kinase/response regulator